MLERLATTEKCTIVVERQPDKKMRVTSGSWEGEKVFLRPGWRCREGTGILLGH